MIDDRDYEIIEMLCENSRYSAREISQKSKIPVMTVLNRIKKLEANGIIRRYTVKLDYEKLGFNIICYIMAKINYPRIQKKNRSHEDVARAVAKYPFVSCVSSLAGHRDMILRVRAKDVKELNKFICIIGSIDGIMATETSLVLNDIQRTSDAHRDVIKMAKDKDFAEKIMKMES